MYRQHFLKRTKALNGETQTQKFERQYKENRTFSSYRIKDPDALYLSNDLQNESFQALLVQVIKCGYISEDFETFYEIKFDHEESTECASDEDIQSFFAKHFMQVMSKKNYIDFGDPDPNLSIQENKHLLLSRFLDIDNFHEAIVTYS